MDDEYNPIIDEFPMKRYHYAERPTVPFNSDELAVLTQLLKRSIEKTGVQGRVAHDIHGEIYTRLRQELYDVNSSPGSPHGFNGEMYSRFADLFGRKFKNLNGRLSDPQRRQIMTLFNELTGGSYSRYQRNQTVEVQKSEIEQLELLTAQAQAASNEAQTHAKTAENVSQQIKELDEFLTGEKNGSEAK